MPRFRITIEYDGGPFVGWQAQDNGPSVQGAVAQAVTALSGETVSVFGAGRTDAGVHARGQVAHFDLTRDWNADRIRDGLNHHLKPATISVLEAAAVDEGFHARFSAAARHYLYRVINRRSPPALLRGRAWHVARPLDAATMNDAAQLLTGRHDFTTFRSVHCQARSPVKTIDRLTVSRCVPETEFIEVRASARSFLHNQVRSIVGTLKRVGEGAWTPEDVRTALEAAERSACGPVAPPDGLYLVAVDYPDDGNPL